jgi:short-subunit dehydrogenase
MTFTVAGSRILITGAAMGMGRLYAERAVAEGAALVLLWDVNKAQLAETVTELTASTNDAQHVVGTTVDISDAKAVEKACADVITKHGGVDVIINNAGVVTGALFVDHEPERGIDLTMRVNAIAPMLITRAFLPGMIAGGADARVVNISSASAFVSNPRMSVYAASKWAMLGWSDTIRLELEQMKVRNVKVLTVCPSYISTGMFAGAKGPLLMPIMKPGYVVWRVWTEMIRGKKNLLILPPMARISTLVKGILPQGAYDWVADKIFGVYHTMDQFTGRTK